MKSLPLVSALLIALALPTMLAAQDQQAPPSPPPDQQAQPPQPLPVVQHEHGAMHNDHGELGVYADYFRFNPSGATNTSNFVGAGGRVGLNVHPNLALEAEMNYDFARGFTNSYTSGSTTTLYTSSVRPLSGFFGPKLQFGTGGPFRAFVEGKAGFIDFSVNNSGVVTGSGFTNAVAGVGDPGTHVAFFPGGGVEMFAGWLGLRIDAGDEIYLNSGTYNNLRVTAGPVIRF